MGIKGSGGGRLGANIGGGRLGATIAIGMGVDIASHVPQRKPQQPIKNPFFAEKMEFRLGLYQIIQEKDDYLICQGWNPNAKGTSARFTPSAFQPINVAKPSLLQKTGYHGQTVNLIVDGTPTEVTFNYSSSEVGKRTATAGEVTEIQRITMDYFVGDTITAVEVRKNSAVDGCDTLTETGSRLTWVDLNFSGRCWAVSSE